MISHVDIICVGKLKHTSPFHSLFQEYAKRLLGKLNLYELDGHSQAEEHKKIIEKLSASAPLIILDERGKSLSSLKFAQKLSHLQEHKSGHLQFVIGGADGLSDELRQRADLVLSFGAQTWPHMMARVMLIEQIYRAQQILAGHPYHRE